MKFTCQVEVNLPLERVVQLQQDPSFYGEWQDGFVGIEHLSGEPGGVGSQSRLRYQIGKRELILDETILVNDPTEFRGLYEAREMTNTMTNRFRSSESGGTVWQSEIEYTKFNGMMPRLMAKLFPGMFRKQTQKWLDQFKEFAERRSC